jgi:hypothetical protein
MKAAFSLQPQILHPKAHHPCEVLPTARADLLYQGDVLYIALDFGFQTLSAMPSKPPITFQRNQ